MFNKHHHHLENVLHLKTRLGRLYQHLLIQAFALSSISVFIPVYLLTLGFGLKEVFMFLLVEWSVFGLLAPVWGVIIHGMGLKEVLLLRTPLLAGVFLMLVGMESVPLLREYVYWVAAASGFSGGLYTLSIMSLFTKFMSSQKESVSVSRFHAIPQMGSMVGPVLGGVISYVFGFSVLFILVTLLLLASVFPLSFVKKNLDHPKYKLGFVGFYGKFKKNVIFLMVAGLRGVVWAIFIPLALYMQEGNELTLGAFVSVMGVIGVIATLTIGRLTNAYGLKMMLKSGIVISALGFLMLAQVIGSYLFYGIATFVVLGGLMYGVSYETWLFDAAKKSGSPLDFLVFREFNMSLGRLVLFSCLILLNWSLVSGFYLAGILSFVFLFF